MQNARSGGPDPSSRLGNEQHQFSGPCVIATGGRTSEGYAVVAVGGRSVYAHRLAYEQARGPIPDGLQLDHLCRNRACANPAHLEAVTSRQNTLRGNGPAGLNSRKTECVHGHAFDASNTKIRTRASGGRQCRRCKQATDGARRANRRAAAANTAPETVDALAEATALHLRMLGRWQPLTLKALLDPTTLPGSARLAQLTGGAK